MSALRQLLADWSVSAQTAEMLGCSRLQAFRITRFLPAFDAYL